jgi:ATP-dependent RNA helicase DeaD
VLNGDLSQDTREATLNRFRQNQIKVLVATDVAARGLDIDGISHVFNYDLPEDPELYVHRIGRTGRAGKTGIAISLLSPAETRKLRQIENFSRKKIQRATLPTEEQIRAKRENIVMDQLKMWLRRGRCLHEKAQVEAMIAEGMNAVDIAAAALKMARAEEKQRPIMPVTEVPEYRQDRYDRPARRGQDDGRAAGRPSSRETGRSGFGRRSEVSHERGMVRLSLNKGWRDGIRPSDIVGAIAAHTGIPGSAIGRINIEEQHSLVDVPEELVTIVLDKTGEVRIRRQPILLERA